MNRPQNSKRQELGVSYTILHSLPLVSKKVEIEFSLTPNRAIARDTLDGRNKFIVSDPTTAIGGMSRIRFRTG